MKKYLSKKINWRFLAISGSLFFLFILIVLPNVSSYTEEIVGGLASPDTSFFYSGAQLYKIADSYGDNGRRNYILLRWTFDVVWPFVYFFFLFSLSVQVSKLFKSKWINQLPWLPILATGFDFLENIFITIVMAIFPIKMLWLGTLASLFTLAKWSLLYLSFSLIGILLLYYVIRQIAVKLHN